MQMCSSYRRMARMGMYHNRRSGRRFKQEGGIRMNQTTLTLMKATERYEQALQNFNYADNEHMAVAVMELSKAEQELNEVCKEVQKL